MKRIIPAFVSVLAVRLCFELLARWSDNSYLCLQAWPAAVSAGLLTVVGVYLARRIVRDGDNVALAASVVAVVAATLVGVEDLKQRRESAADQATETRP